MSYPGAKTAAGVHQAIIAQMPPHDVFIETHLGSGAIMARKPPAARNIGIDRSRVALRLAFPTVQVAGPELVCSRAEEFLAGFDFVAAGRVLVYADPPYIQGAGEVRSGARLYEHEYTREDHARLLLQLDALPCAVMVSGYPSQLYSDMLADWRAIEFQAMTRGGPRTEKLWLNFPAGQVQWSTFAGKNHTQRQHVKRQAARWAGKFRRMTPARRCAILAALLEVESGPP
jgi:DNA adenine methylase